MAINTAALMAIANNETGRKLFHHPWQIAWKGKPAAVVSDGFRLLLQSGQNEYPMVDKGGKGSFLAIIDQPLMDIKQVSLIKLRDAIGISICPKCGTPCAVCCGSKESRFFSYAGLPFNANLFVGVLALLDSEDGWVSVTRSEMALHIWCDPWHFALAGIIPSPGSEIHDVKWGME